MSSSSSAAPSWTENVLISSLADWVWGSSPDPAVSPATCLNSLLPIPWSNPACLSALFAKALGVAIICGACLNKLPVVLNVLSSGTVAGLSTGALYGEVIMYSNSALYGVLRGNPFTAYGENFAVAVQSIFLVLLLWKFKTDPRFTAGDMVVAVVAYGAYLAGCSMFLPYDKLFLLHTANWPALLISRGSQIVETSRVKHTGTQSIVTHGMNLLGSLIRIGTTLQEVGWDLAMLGGYMVSVTLNTMLVLQYFLYRKNTAQFLADLESEKARKKKA